VFLAKSTGESKKPEKRGKKSKRRVWQKQKMEGKRGFQKKKKKTQSSIKKKVNGP
jgi:hypothetical protein